MSLSVGSNPPSGSVAHFGNSTGFLLHHPNYYFALMLIRRPTEGNVLRSLTFSGMDSLLKLRPVTFNWNQEAPGTPTHTGFIAQEVQSVFPDLISQGPDGYFTMNYAGLTPYLVKAVQEIGTISGTFKANLIAWLSSAENGIVDFYASIVHANDGHFANKICVGSGASETCINQQQLAALLGAATNGTLGANSGSPGTGYSTTTNAVTTPPVISIKGNNPAQVTVGTTYDDLGATITGPLADLNLGITVIVDNATSTNGTAQIDTTKPGTHTILYTVTDPQDLKGSATRTVIRLGGE